MRIGVMAAGAVGGYFGGRLAAAGHDVVFFARGANLAALRQHGLKIESVKGDVQLY
jgi:2-dehydropantoate 2-reductase